MNILLTNNTLDERAGTECYIRDVAIGLLRRGHRPIAYSTKVGAVAEELRAVGVPVVDDLRTITIVPDVIHAQHHLEAMAALLYFSEVPAMYVCHGWKPWQELPPKFPRIRRYGAVDEATYDRLTVENTIPPERVTVLRNFVELESIKRRGPLPTIAKRAAIFSSYVTSDSIYYHAIHEACQKLSIELDVIGKRMDSVVARPGAMLGEYDLIFAQGRSALEAMAAGTAVMICSSRAFGPLVTTSNFDSLREQNFGLRTLCYPARASTVLQELAHYSPLDAQAVSELTRVGCSIEDTLDDLLSLYASVIQEQRVSVAAGDERKSAACYIQEISGHYKLVVSTNNALQQELDVLRRFVAESEGPSDEVQALSSEVKVLTMDVEQMTGSLTWRARNFLMRFRCVLWIRQALRKARGV